MLIFEYNSQLRIANANLTSHLQFIFFYYYFLLSLLLPFPLSINILKYFCLKCCYFLKFKRKLKAQFYISGIVQYRYRLSLHMLHLCNFDEYLSNLRVTITTRVYFFGGHSRDRTRGRIQREETMRVRRTKQLKWDEVQDTVCSSRRNFAHVPLSRSLQPGKGRMAGKSRTVEVRFYKGSLRLRGDGGKEQMPLEYLYFTMQMEKYSQVHLQGGAGRRDGFIYIMHYSLLFVASVCASTAALLSSFFLFFFISVSLSLPCRFFRLVSGARGACNSFLLPK